MLLRAAAACDGWRLLLPLPEEVPSLWRTGRLPTVAARWLHSRDAARWMCDDRHLATAAVTGSGAPSPDLTTGYIFMLPWGGATGRTSATGGAGAISEAVQPTGWLTASSA